METILIIAIAIFALLIAGEFAYGLAVKRNNYRLNDAISSLSQGALSQIVAVFTQLFQIGIYTAIYSSVTLLHHEKFWSQWAGVVLAVLLYDFFDYWLHRMSHEVAVLWAAHVVHHQSEEFNFTTALRQESLYPVVGFVFFVPMAVLGIPPTAFAMAGFVVLFYQFWIHTEHIGTLGWLDRVFSTPSNHRVHHAVNPQYLDKNYGAILIIWDRLFSSFAEEKERCVYGIVQPLNSWDPVWAASHVFVKLAETSIATRRWSDKLKVWWKPPGWQPPDLAQGLPDAMALPIGRRRYDPAVSPAAAWFAGIHMVVLAGALCLFLWHEEQLPTALLLGCALQMIAMLWLVAAVMQGRVTMAKGLAAELLLLMLAAGGAFFLV